MKLGYAFFNRQCLQVARDLVGKVLVRRTEQGVLRFRISETEAYCGETDTACHVHRGRTKRTEVFYRRAGTMYVYLCYGLHWMLNIVTGEEGDPQAVLIRACVEAPGPGRLTKALGITGSFNDKYIPDSDTLWIEDDGYSCEIAEDTRVGIGYASAEDQAKLWRFKLKA